MTDLDIGPNLNVLTGFRSETNITEYFSRSSLDHALAHWILVYDSTKQLRKNSYFLPAIFVRHMPLSWLTIRIAQTKTLTRPDYSSIIPLIGQMALLKH